MNETRVVNRRFEKCDVYIGRGSVFGNQFHIGKDGNRMEVIEKYRVYFNRRVVKDLKFRDAVMGLRGKALGCYCKPLACHGDVIVEYLKKVG